MTLAPRLRLLWLYMLRQVGAPFALAATILLLALALERMLRLIDMIAADGAPIGKVFVLLAYLMPHYLQLALPAAFFLAALLAFRRLQERSELAIVQATGLSPRILLRPVLALATLLTLLLLVVAGHIDPLSRYDYRAAAYRLSASGQLLNLQPGVFTPIGADIVVRAAEVAAQKRLGHVIVYQNNPEAGDRTYGAAPTGRIERDAQTGLLTLILENGDMVRDNDIQPSGALYYKEYAWPMPAKGDTDYSPRGRDEREMTFLELLTGGVPGVATQSTREKERAELQARLVQALSLPLFGIAALPLALIGTGRSGRAWGIIAGIALFIFYDKIVGFGQAAAAHGRLSPYVSLWLPWLTLAAITGALLVWKTPARLRVRVAP